MAAKDNAYATGYSAGASGATAPPKQKDYLLIQATNAGFEKGRQPPPTPPVRCTDGKQN